MKRRITLVGLAALCALAFSAIAASGASAGVTAFTCAGPGTTNSHCDPGSSGTSGHVAIPADETTELTLTALNTGILGANVFGAEVELSSNQVGCTGCSFHNHTDANNVMEVTGSGGRLHFTNVEVVKGSANCTVTDDTVAENSHTITTEPLKFTDNTSATSATLEPEVGTTLTHFKIITTPNTHTKVCNLIGTYTVTGKVTLSFSGATAKANVTKASKELLLNGEEASLTGEFTQTAGKPVTPQEPNPSHGPIALTAGV